MSASIVSLSRLVMVPLREAWPDEATNFTPWLAEEPNLALLGEALGLPLALEAKEKPVGAFAADILARDSNSGNWVLIENQLTPTDHRHLGQLLTYAAGLDARTVVWVAEAFREEHRAAIDFLNQATTDGYSFFAVQIELYRIGESPFAPRFSVVSKPNDWNKKAQLVRSSLAEIPNETQLQYQEYWTALITAAANRYPALASRNPWKTNAQRIENLRGGDPALVIDAVFAWDKGLRLNVYIDGLLAKVAFRQLLECRQEIERRFGNELVWEELPEARASRISFYMPGIEKRENKSRWPMQHDWIITWAPKLADAIRPSLAALQTDRLQQHPED